MQIEEWYQHEVQEQGVCACAYPAVVFYYYYFYTYIASSGSAEHYSEESSEMHYYKVLQSYYELQLVCYAYNYLLAT